MPRRSDSIGVDLGGTNIKIRDRFESRPMGQQVQVIPAALGEKAGANMRFTTPPAKFLALLPPFVYFRS